MNTSLLLRVGIASAGLLLSAFANAQSSDREPGWEAGLDVIYQDSSEIRFDGGSTVNLDDDLGLSLTFGYRFNPHMELQFALDWADVDYRAHIVGRDSSGSGSFVAFDGHGSMESFTPRVNLQINLLDRPITPFVMGGVGYTFVDTNIPEGRAQTACWWDPWYGYICNTYQNTKTADDLTYQLGAGVRFDFGHSGSLRIAYEHHWIDLSNVSGDAAVDQIKLGFIYRY